MAIIERVWYGHGAIALAGRIALSPLELLYRGIVAARGAMFDRGVRASAQSSIPVISVGNLTVGGTGKTPIASWVASELARRGMQPAIVLRGYGDDEPAVHRLLTPGISVIASADRLAGVRRARAAGCDVGVLDDAFQHRQLRRAADVVLVSAERWRADARLLPAGPYREPPSALRRATLVVVTRKSASREAADEVVRWVHRVAPQVAVAMIHLTPDELRSWDDATRASVSGLVGERILAIAAIGDPGAFARQLQSLGATVELRAFRDHHAFTDRDAQHLAAQAARFDRVVCTLKDAVKLGPVWPRAASRLWYVSQRVRMESGAGALDRLLDGIAASVR